MTQAAAIGLPSLETLKAFLPGGEPAPELSPPPNASVRWNGSKYRRPVLVVEPDVPEGTRYLFTADQLLFPEFSSTAVNRWLDYLLKGAIAAVRRVLLLLSLIPLEWVAPAPLPPGGIPMTSPTTRPDPVPVPGGIRVVHRGASGGQTIIMTHGMLDPNASVTSAQLQAIANAARDAFQAQLLGRASNAYSYSGVAVYDESPNAAALAEAQGTGVGGQVGRPASLTVAAILSHKTALAGRRYRGRTFFGPIHEGSLNAEGRTITDAVRTGLGQSWANYRQAVEGAAGVEGAVFAVLSSYGFGTPITTTTVSQVHGTQRKRLR